MHDYLYGKYDLSFFGVCVCILCYISFSACLSPCQARGERSNRLKEQQLDLFADRTSTQTFESNQLRLWLSSMAYVLMQAFRQHCLSNTSFAQATVGTIRLSFLKLGARITMSVRRILIAIASACPSQDILRELQRMIDPIITLFCHSREG